MLMTAARAQSNYQQSIARKEKNSKGDPRRTSSGRSPNFEAVAAKTPVAPKRHSTHTAERDDTMEIYSSAEGRDRADLRAADGI